MAITGDDLRRTLEQAKQRRLQLIEQGVLSPDDIEEPPELTDEDEAILDGVWDNLDNRKR